MSSTELKRIMCVEDEPDIRTVAKMALELVGKFEVEMCESGAKAVLQGPVFRPDLLLLDVMMPDMDGPATLQELRKLPELARTPAIFITAKVQSHEIHEYLKLGAIGVIAKPFDPINLANEIRMLWAKHHG